MQQGLLCIQKRGAGCVWYRILCSRKQKRDLQLDRLQVPFFVFVRKLLQSLLRKASSLWEGAWCNGKRLDLTGNGAAMPKVSSPMEQTGEVHVYFASSASCRYSCAAPPPGYFTVTKALFRMHTPSEYTVSRTLWSSASP